MKKLAAWLAAMVIAAVAASAYAEVAGQDALDAVKPWVDSIDGGHYEYVWESSSAQAKSTSVKNNFVAIMQKNRGILGQAIERNVMEANVYESLPGAPPGPYLIVKYSTNFAARPNTEEVFTMRMEDGYWRLVSYNLK